MEPKIINGNIYVDDRGYLVYSNDFDMSRIKRFYAVENINTNVVRAFHGHRKEEKYVLVISGTALFVIAKMEENNKLVNPQRFVLSARSPKILYIPSGYSNGFKSLEDKTKIIFFSTLDINESRNDDYRDKWNVFGEKIWEVENR